MFRRVSSLCYSVYPVLRIPPVQISPATGLNALLGCRGDIDDAPLHPRRNSVIHAHGGALPRALWIVGEGDFGAALRGLVVGQELAGEFVDVPFHSVLSRGGLRYRR